MGELGQENERLRRICDQPTWVLTHMDNDSFRSILEPAYKISWYRPTDSWKRLFFSPVSPLRPRPSSVHKTLLLGLCRESWRSGQSRAEKKGMVKIFQLLSWKETSLRKINLPSYWGSWGLSGVWAPVSSIWWSVLFKAILYVRRGSQSNRFHGYLSH